MTFPELRPYQKELCRYADPEEYAKENVYVYAPTGTGKTEVACEYRTWSQNIQIRNSQQSSNFGAGHNFLNALYNT